MTGETTTVTATVATAAPTERRFAFDFGDGRRWIASRAVLTEIPIGASLQLLPNAPPMLAGAINVRGAIRLVFDPLRFAGEIPAEAGAGQRRILLIDRDEHCAGVLISGEPVLVEIRPDPAPYDAGPFTPFVHQVWADNHGRPVYEFDHRQWFKHLRGGSSSNADT